MRKFYSFIAFAVMMVVSLTANAQTMTEENATLDELGFRLEKDVNFVAGTVNGNDIDPKNTFVAGNTDTYTTNGYNPVRLANSGLEFLSLEFLENGIDWPANHGLRSTKNERWICINNLREGQIVTFDISNTDTVQFVVNSIACNNNTGWADTPADPQIVEPISGSIHELQELAEAGSADAFRYFKVINAGPLLIKFNGKKANEIYRMQIWSDKNDAEAVAAPTYKIVGVDRSSRNIELKAGESTLGNACTVTYGIMDTEGATNEDYEYDPSVGYFTISSSDDEDGDGYVIIEAVTISESGLKSEPARFQIAVGDVVLNTPTISLMSVNGEERAYKIDWTRNTIGEEPVTIAIEGSGADSDLYTVLEDNTGIGTTFAIKDHAKVTVSATGYADAVVELDAEAKGINISRKNTATDGEGNTIHDWNFVNLSEEMSAQFHATIPASYNEYIVNEETTDTISHTVAEYEAAEEAGIDVSGWEIVPASFGWDTTIQSNRTTLNTAEGGLDMNENGIGYAEEKTGIFHDLALSCPPNNKNNSTILKYLDKADGNELGYLGVYFMAKPTFTFPRSVAKAGEYVEIYYGQGGSNYTNYTTHGFYKVPEDQLLSVTLPNNGVHVFYIDVYTYENLPEEGLENAEEAWNQVVAIEGVNTNDKAAAYFTASGAKLTAPAKGINIVKYTNGQVKKVFIK